MPVQIRASIVGSEELRRRLARLNPKKNKRIMSEALKKCAAIGQADAAKKQIIRGGKGRPHPTRLTSRKGTGRRSIRINLGGPVFAEYGTDLKYMAAHEFGGTFDVPSVWVRSHSRRVAFGKKRKRFTVPGHLRMGHEMKIPPRPFLAPSLDIVIRHGPDILLKALERHAG